MTVIVVETYWYDYEAAREKIPITQIVFLQIIFTDFQNQSLCQNPNTIPPQGVDKTYGMVHDIVPGGFINDYKEFIFLSSSSSSL